jgi:HPt (histidine-containing phosphotransfer) domain-containing protein
MGNHDFVQRVLSRFQSSFEEDLTRLEAGLMAGDAIAIADVAHRMKGAAANTAAPGLHREAATIEQLARAERTDELSHWVGRLRQEWTRFVDSLSSPDRSAVGADA